MTQDINSPAGMAAVMAEALRAQGAQVRIGTVDDRAGGGGFLVVRTPDGECYRLMIEPTW